MKRINNILVIFILLFTINMQAQTKEVELPHFSDERIEDLSNRICRSALSLRTTSAKTAGMHIENMILKFLSTSREDPNHKAILTKFWNTYNEKLICYDEGSTKRTRTPQHFMKRVVDLGMYKSILYDFLLYDEDEYPIDVNAVETYNGKEETLLDYLDAIIANPSNADKYNMKEIIDLRGTIIEDYGAKRASEL